MRHAPIFMRGIREKNFILQEMTEEESNFQ